MNNNRGLKRHPVNHYAISKQFITQTKRVPLKSLDNRLFDELLKQRKINKKTSISKYEISQFRNKIIKNKDKVSEDKENLISISDLKFNKIKSDDYIGNKTEKNNNKQINLLNIIKNTETIDESNNINHMIKDLIIQTHPDEITREEYYKNKIFPKHFLNSKINNKLLTKSYEIFQNSVNSLSNHDYFDKNNDDIKIIVDIPLKISLTTYLVNLENNDSIEKCYLIFLNLKNDLSIQLKKYDKIVTNDDGTEINGIKHYYKWSIINNK